MSLSWPFAIPVKQDTTFSIGGVVDAGGPTFFIACSFIFIAYILHPYVEHSLLRVRAHRAWRAIEKGQDVEVTQYTHASELFGARGVWSCDAARMAVFLLCFFTLFSGLLELSLGICYYGTDFPPSKKWVDLLDRPPPVYNYSDSSWLVPFKPSSDSDVEATGYFGNFLKYNGSDDIYDQGKATSVYRVYPSESSCNNCSSSHSDDLDCGQHHNDGELVRGNIVIARWSNSVIDGLYYNASLSGKLACESNQGNDSWPKTVCLADDDNIDQASCAFSQNCEKCTWCDISGYSRWWGNVSVCDEGPRVNTTGDGDGHDETALPPPVILLYPNSGTDCNSSDVFVIAEETSDFFPFLYSVWTGDAREDKQNLTLLFYVESRSRLVEAIITAIVYDEGDESRLMRAGGGGRCLDLVAEFSDRFEDHDIYRCTDKALLSIEESGEKPAVRRARPFGEHPSSSHRVVQDLFEVEPIEYGVAIDLISVVCGPGLMLLLTISTIWSLLVCSRIGIDVYDRDELIKAVCLPNQTMRDGVSSPHIRMFVRKKLSGGLDVECIPVERTDGEGWTAWMRKLPLPLNKPVPQSEPPNEAEEGSRPATEVEDDDRRRQMTQMSKNSFRFGRARSLPIPRDVVATGGYMVSLSPSLASSPASSSASSVFSLAARKSTRCSSGNNEMGVFHLTRGDIDQTEHEEEPPPEGLFTQDSSLPPRVPKSR